MTKKKIIFRAIIVVLLISVLIVNSYLNKVREEKATYVPAEYEEYTATNSKGTICEASVRGLIPLAEKSMGYGTSVMGYYFLAILDDMTTGAVYMDDDRLSEFEDIVVAGMSDLSDFQSKEPRIIRGRIIDMPEISGNLFDYVTSDMELDYDAYSKDTDALNKSVQDIKVLNADFNYPDTKPVYPNIPVLSDNLQFIVVALLIICLIKTGIDIHKALQ